MKNKIKDLWIDLNNELHYFILSKVKEREDARDILQDVFIKIHMNIDQLQNTSKLTPWVYQITRNTIIDYYRKKKDMKDISEFDFAENEDESAGYSKLADCINKKIDLLSEEYKEAMVLTKSGRFLAARKEN